MKINYKSDFELDYTLLDEHGQPIAPPDCPWKLVLSVGNPLKPYVGQCDCINGRNFVAEYDGENYHNCRVQDNVIRVFVDNHGLPCGQLWATFITYTPNTDFPDGNRRVYTPQATDTFLVAEAGDDPTPAQIQYTANYVVYEHEYTAGQGIEIDGLSIGLSEEVLEELESHDEDIRSITDDVEALESGKNRSLRLNDTTSTGEIGKIPKISESPYGNHRGMIVIYVIKANVIEDDNSVWYAFPSSSAETKQAADDILLGMGDKIEINQTIAGVDSDLQTYKRTTTQALEGKASNESVNALAERVTTNEGDISQLQQDFTDLNGDVADVNDDIRRINDNISANYYTKTEIDATIGDINTLLSAI